MPEAFGIESDPRSFISAIEWATDGEWPYVAALAVAEITGSQAIEQMYCRSYSGSWVTAGCLAIVILLILMLALRQYCVLFN